MISVMGRAMPKTTRSFAYRADRAELMASLEKREEIRRDQRKSSDRNRTNRVEILTLPSCDSSFGQIAPFRSLWDYGYSEIACFHWPARNPSQSDYL